MATAPKLTYAKTGKASKARAESASLELARSKDDKSGDLFSHMNQENLNYIKKQLKLKKTRADQDPPIDPLPTPADPGLSPEDEATQRNKIYQKYRGEQEVSEKEDHLEDTQRRSEEDRPLDLMLPEDIEEDYNPSDPETARPENRERNFLSSTYHHNPDHARHNGKKEGHWPQMCQSLPYEEGRKRLASIEGFFGEAVSTNLNKHDGGLFIEFLEEYITDLNHSDHPNHTQQPRAERSRKEGEAPQSREKGRVEAQRRGDMRKQDGQERVDRQDRQDRVDRQDRQDRVDRAKRSSDTFGQPNSKYSLQSNNSRSSLGSGREEVQLRLREERLKSLMLAQEVERMRRLLACKEDVIKKAHTQNDLLREDLRHLKIKQDIHNKSKPVSSPHDYSAHTSPLWQSRNHRVTDENQVKYSDFREGSHSHQRHASTNHHQTLHSHRNSIRPSQDLGELFQPFAQPQPARKASRDKPPRREKGSLQKWEREYSDFLLEQKHTQRNLRGAKRAREGIL